jgi:hypothetical protein
MRIRMMLGTLGTLTILYGAWRIIGTARLTRPTTLAEWLIGAVIAHDAVIAPATMVVGLALNKVVAPRARRYVVGALIASALVTAVAVPLIYRRGTQPRSTTLEAQDYGLHLAVLVGLIAAAAAAAYFVRVLRDRRAQQLSDANDRPPADQVSTTE